MWKARVLPKIKYFVWRLIHGIIPIGEILQRKGLYINISCAVCGRLRETIKHVFLECRFSQAVWTLCAPEVNQVQEESWESVEMWDQIFKWLADKDMVEIWMIVVWFGLYGTTEIIDSTIFLAEFHLIQFLQQTA